MLLSDIIAERATKGELVPRAAAAYLGFSLEEYRDFDLGFDSALELRVVHFVRFCVLFRDNLEDLVSSVSDTVGNIISVPFEELKRITAGVEQHSDEVGWEAAALTDWFKDEHRFCDIPIPALKDVCDFYNIDIRGVLLGYLRLIGVTLDHGTPK
ncbi:MAG: hypothetical protein ACLQVD_20820 [Capsulimonadaceae bacterium]